MPPLKYANCSLDMASLTADEPQLLELTDAKFCNVIFDAVCRSIAPKTHKDEFFYYLYRLKPLSKKLYVKLFTQFATWNVASHMIDTLVTDQHLENELYELFAKDEEVNSNMQIYLWDRQVVVEKIQQIIPLTADDAYKVYRAYKLQDRLFYLQALLRKNDTTKLMEMVSEL